MFCACQKDAFTPIWVGAIPVQGRSEKGDGFDMPMYQVHIRPHYVAEIEADSLKDARQVAYDVDFGTCDELDVEYEIEELTSEPGTSHVFIRRRLRRPNGKTGVPVPSESVGPGSEISVLRQSLVEQLQAGLSPAAAKILVDILHRYLFIIAYRVVHPDWYSRIADILHDEGEWDFSDLPELNWLLAHLCEEERACLQEGCP